jgi:hypothetical protein
MPSGQEGTRSRRAVPRRPSLWTLVLMVCVMVPTWLITAWAKNNVKACRGPVASQVLGLAVFVILALIFWYLVPRLAERVGRSKDPRPE